MTMAFWRRAAMLKRLVSLLGSLVAAPLGVGCTKGDVPAKRTGLEAKTFKADFPVTEEQYRQIMRGRDRGDRFARLTFSETLRFSRLDETVETNGYDAETLGDDGEAYTGKFAMKATLRRGYTGGPPGSATELFVEVDDVRLVEVLSAPKAPPGAKALVPGQIVVRKIAVGELARLDDRYVIDLPAGKKAVLSFDPLPKQYPFVISVFKDGKSLPVKYDKLVGHLFDTAEAGIHELRVGSGGPAAREPDSYSVYVFWGEGLSVGGPICDHRVGWRSPAAPGGSTTREVKR
jgi:hypothetical protein